MTDRVVPSAQHAESLWRIRVEQELKGKPFDSLIHRIGEKNILPMYFDHEWIAPRNSSHPWFIHEEFTCADANELNALILMALQGGAQSIGIPFLAGKMEVVLKDVFVEFVQVHLRDVSDVQSCLNEMEALLHQRNLEANQWQGSMEVNANACSSDAIKEMHSRWKNTFTRIRFFAVNSSSIHDTGVDSTAELVHLLWHSNATLETLICAGLSPDDASAMMHWRMGIGTDFLNETAKFRAWRIIWDALIRAYHPQHNCSSHTIVHAHMSNAEYSLRDTHNNLLRISTAVLSAALGGAQIISADAYTHLTGNITHADRRITRNVQHLLVEECSLHQYSDATDGAHYFEAITEALANEAWSKFKTFSDLGENALTDYFNTIASERKANIVSGKQVVVGSNKYVDASKTISAPPQATHISAVAERT